jgi:hypothetical protein
VKESLKGYASRNVFVQPTENFFLTIHDLSAWYILIPLLPDLKNKTLVFLYAMLVQAKPLLRQPLPRLSQNTGCCAILKKKGSPASA